MASLNPDCDSWVLDWVIWYLDEEGYPDKNKNGKQRYLLIVNDSPVFADTQEELIESYPDLCWQYNDVTGENTLVPPLSITVLLGTIFDNPAILKCNPKYLAALKAQSEVNRKRLLDGCWFARAEGSNYFNRTWLKKLDKIPLNCMEVRAWDLASSESSEKNRTPDYSACIKMLKDSNNNVIIVGGFSEECIDKEEKLIYGKFRKRPGDRDNIIAKQAAHDGDDCIIILPQDPGAAGAFTFQSQAKALRLKGFTAKADPTPSNKSKLKRFTPFSTAAEQGDVYIVESSFPNKQTLESFYKELEAFDGERSTTTRKDDWVDAVSSGFSYLMSKGRLHKPIPFGNIQSESIKSIHGL